MSKEEVLRLEKHVMNLQEEISRLRWYEKIMCEDMANLNRQLIVAKDTLKKYADKKNWRDSVTELNTDFFEYENSMYNMSPDGYLEAEQALNEMDKINSELTKAKEQ